VKILNEFPEGLQNVSSTELHKIVEPLTLFHVKGQKEPALFLSCLMHGNENTGLLVIQELIKKYGTDNWPRSCYILFGNVEAAAVGKRQLDGDLDYNRIWKEGDLPENEKALSILKLMEKTPLFASLDIHNNTGRNPHYTVVVKQHQDHLNLAALFGETSVFFGERIGAFTENFGDFCPSVTIEAGLPGVESGTTAVLNFIEKLMPLDEMPREKPKLNLLEVFGIIKIPEKNTVGVGDEEADIVFPADLDGNNFKPLEKAAVIAQTGQNCQLSVQDLKGNDINYLSNQDGQVVVKEPFIPAMITLDTKIIKSDCLCYMMRLIDRG